jgi:uncharacterized protein
LPVCLLLAATAPLTAQLPKAQGYVTDLAGVLDSTARSEIESRLRSAEEKTSAEIAVATVSSLDGMTIEDYANRLFREWGVGKKGKDNGVLLLVATAAREVRIEVGYGLEPVLPDGLAGDIIRNDIVPAFKNGDYPLGILAGVRRVATIVEANHTLTPEERRQLTEGDQPPMLLMIPFFGLFVALGSLAFGVGLRTRSIVPLIWGGMFGGMPFLMSLIPFFNASVLVLGPLALAMLVLGYVKGGTDSWMKAARGTASGKGHATDSTGWVMGGSSSSSKGGGSRSSGGSFGGGSSGGGGASGRW